MTSLIRYNWIAVLLAALLPASACADIYMQEDDTEEVYLTNLVDTDSVQTSQTVSHKQGNKRFKVLLEDEKTALAPVARPPLDNPALPFAQAVSMAAAETSLEPALLHAVIAVESNNNTHAISSRGARGLMQLMPATSKRYAVSNPHDPSQNIAAGARYLQALQHMFNGDTRLALAAYNAGPGAVIKSGFKIPAYSETQYYVPRVMQLYRKFSGLKSVQPQSRQQQSVQQSPH